MKVWKFYKRKEERIIQLFELSCHKTVLFYLFLYICEWKQILLKKLGQGKLITEFYGFTFVCLLLILWILNSYSIFVTMCTFAQFWGTFNKEKYRINSFAQNIWITNFQSNEFIETRFHCMTLAQRTRKDVKYFKVKLYIFFCNYLEYHLVSWESNLRNLYVNSSICHHYFH